MSENLNDALELKSETDPQPTPETQPEKNGKLKGYPALLVISAIYTGLAWLVAIAALIAVIVGFSTLGKTSLFYPQGEGLLIMAFSYGLFGILGCLAVSKGIRLFIDMATNSQKQVQLLTRLLDEK